MSALDLDALERLTRAYADAHAAMLADDRSAQAWLDDEAASKALAAHYGGQWASPAQCVDVLALITRLRAAEARTAWQPIETAPRGADLRTLAQAVVDAGPTECIWPVNAPTSALLKALMPEVGDKASPLYDTARAILAALNAADAQGYARAMGEVVTLCTARYHGTKPRDEYSDHTLGWLDATDAVASWARERLPAAAERD